MLDFYFLFVALTLLPYLVFSFFKTKRAIHMLQQNQYYFTRYTNWLKLHVSETLLKREMLVYFIMFVALVVRRDVNEQMIIFVVGQFLLAFVYKFEKHKKPLVFTPRVKRLFFTMFVITMILAYLSFNNDLIIGYSLVVFYALISFIQVFIFFILVVAHAINWPFERGVYYRYFYDAKFKLNRHKRITKIGITGSFGKTSSKNIINTILGYRFNTLASPASYNTPMGLTRTIREKLKPIHDVFIAEMGAYKIGDIKVLANFIRPKFGVITSIGPAHLESFGSIENIQQGKFELVESLGENGTAILNRDDKMQREYVIKNRCHVKWYGINEDADVMASDIKLSSKGTTFTLHIKRDPLIYDITTKLLGEHNVYNILAAITIGVEMGMKVKDLVNAIRYVEPVEHRLSIKKHGHITYIDDAFNSNPVGSKKALEVLDKMPGKKIIVTPGMIELGELQYQLNKEFGEFMSEVCDKIILVGEQQTKPIQDGIKEKGYAEDDLYVVNDVKDAFAIINNLDKEDTYVLLENDLPDLFNE